VRILYFAWIRERVGKSEEEVELPGSVTTVGDLMNWLKKRGEGYAYAFDNPKVVRTAINKVHVSPSTEIKDAHEIAFFPQMTGG
jgi:molybdopterin synthase sulfur carrier subunit